MDQTPASLLERVRAREPDAWPRFVRVCTPYVFHLAARCGATGEEAADLVQDVFVVLVEQLPAFRYDPGRSFRAWLRTVLLNKWRDRCRRRAPAALAGGGADLPDPLAPADEAAAEAEFRTLVVQRALRVMQADFQPATWRACWELVVAERPAADVAAELGLTVNAVYLARARVLARLRRELAGLLE